MADYFVRKGGSDSNDGTTKALAKLTIDAIATSSFGLVAGDNVYIGGGIYRELVGIDISGSSGSPITWIGDIDGEFTDDAGLVVISAYADEVSTASRAYCINLASADTFNIFRNLIFDGGTNTCVGDLFGAGTAVSEGCEFHNCVFNPGHATSDSCFNMELNDYNTPTANGVSFFGCVFNAGMLSFQWDLGGTNEDAKIVIENCVFIGVGTVGTADPAFVWNKVAGTGGEKGGVNITNCSFIACDHAIRCDAETNTTTIVAVENCLFWACGSGIVLNGTNDGGLTSDYNHFSRTSPAHTNVTAGANDLVNSRAIPLLGGLGGDLPLLAVLGWSPYLPFEPLQLRDRDDEAIAYTAGIYGAANATPAPATDLYGNPRPMGTDAADDMGAVEARTRPHEETTTVQAGGSAIRFEGSGYHDFLFPVDAAATTVTVYSRQDTTYAGTLPRLHILDIPGVADIVITSVGADDSFVQMTSGSFTPTAKGIARIRLESLDTSATGKSYFDTLEVA